MSVLHTHVSMTAASLNPMGGVRLKGRKVSHRWDGQQVSSTAWPGSSSSQCL